MKNSLGQYSMWIFSWVICWVFLVSTPGAHALLWNADMNFQNVRIAVSHDVSLERNTDSQTDSNRSKTGVFCRVWIKEVYTFGLKFIAQVQGKQVQKISVICIQDEDNVTRDQCIFLRKEL